MFAESVRESDLYITSQGKKFENAAGTRRRWEGLVVAGTLSDKSARVFDPQGFKLKYYMRC